jgi:hypothetical protein
MVSIATSSTGTQQDQSRQTSQAIVTLSMERWKDLIAKHNIKTAAISRRL